MNDSRAARVLIWSGPVFAVLFIAVGFITGDVPSDSASAAKVLAYYHAHKTKVELGVFLTPLATILLVLFAAQVRTRALAAKERVSGPSIMFAGSIIWAVGLLIGSTVSLSQVDAADKKQLEAGVSLNLLSNATWLPFICGIAVFLVGAGMTALGTRILPTWMGWAALVVGVVSLSPAGYVGFFGAPLWMLIAGIVLAIRGRSPETATPSHSATAVPAAAR